MLPRDRGCPLITEKKPHKELLLGCYENQQHFLFTSVPQGMYAQPPILTEQLMMPPFPPDYTASLIFDRTIEKVSSTTPMGKQSTVLPSSPDCMASLIFAYTERRNLPPSRSSRYYNKT